MGFDDYKVVLYRQDDGSWVAEIPALGGCYALMDTREAALAELQHVFDLIAQEHQDAQRWTVRHYPTAWWTRNRPTAVFQDSSTTSRVGRGIRSAALTTQTRSPKFPDTTRSAMWLTIWTRFGCTSNRSVSSSLVTRGVECSRWLTRPSKRHQPGDAEHRSAACEGNTAGQSKARPGPRVPGSRADVRLGRRGDLPRCKVYLDAGFTNLAESTVGLSSTFSTYVVMLSAGLTPTTRTMYGTFTPPTSR